MTGQLLTQLLVATAMVGASILAHLAGLAALMALMRVHGRRTNGFTGLLDQVGAIVGVAFGLFALHTIEIWAYALLYRLMNATPDLETALYFSTVTYATIGYGDLASATVGGRLTGIVFGHFWIFGVIPMIIGNIISNMLEDRNKFTHAEQEWVETPLRRIADKVGIEVDQPPSDY